MVLPPQFDRLIDYVDHHAERLPRRLALALDDDQYTWSELRETVNRVAAAMLASGIGRGDRVAVWSSPRPQTIVTFLACARIGAMFVGLNPKYQLAEVEYVLHDSTPRLVLAAAEYRGRDLIRELKSITSNIATEIVSLAPASGSPHWQTFADRGATVSADRLARDSKAVHPLDPVTIVYTSGTTGQPKGALLTQWGFAHNYWHVFRERAMSWLRIPSHFTINHLACLGDVTALAVVAGGTQYFMEQFDVPALLEMVQRERLTYMPGLVTHYQLLLRGNDVSHFDLSSLEYVWWGGAATTIELMERILALAPRGSTDFGLTETTGPLIFTPVDASLADKALTIGRPSADFPVRLGDADGRAVSRGETGEIQAHGDHLSPGYFGKPDATRELYTADSWLRTGDLAYERDDGYWMMIGRSKEMFKSGGYNVYPAEVEKAIATHPKVDMVAVVSVPDELYQEVGHAFIKPNIGADLTSDELRAHCRRLLANYKIPKQFFVWDDLPRTPVGKIDKPALQKVAIQRSAT